jgi:hypothetical protein
MLLFFIFFIFFILHIQFLLRNLLIGTDEGTFFFWTIKYLFDRDVTQLSLLFTILCAIGFAIGYLLLYHKKKIFLVNCPTAVVFKHCSNEIYILNLAGVVQVLFGLMQLWSTGLSYQEMAEAKMDSGFVFELRISYLLLLAHLLLNVPWTQLIKRRELRTVRWVLVAYLIITVLGQARSALFEIAAVVIITQLMWVGDKVKFKYVLFVVGALLVPNLIVLGRLGAIDDLSMLIDGVFSFEYSILFNNMLSAVIDRGVNINSELSFVPSLLLIIPSPIRAIFGLTVDKSGYYADIAAVSGVANGGFSLLAEMYSNFGWYAPLVFGAIGLILGIVFSKAAKVGNVGFVGATAPLLYVAFVLAFRNDFGVFLKYVVQLFLIAFIFHLALKRRFGKFNADSLR